MIITHAFVFAQCAVKGNSSLTKCSGHFVLAEPQVPADASGPFQASGLRESC